MMAQIGSATIRLVLANPKSLRALGFAAGVLNEIQEDMPWRDDAKEAAKALEYATRHITPEVRAG